MVDSEYEDYENIEWGIKFDEVYLEYPETNKTENIIILKGVFDFNFDYIIPPYTFDDKIKQFFVPLRGICFEETNPRLFNNDGFNYKQIYCNYTLFKNI